MEVFREFTFDAAHRLEHLPEGHKCARVHGHTYKLIVHVAGEPDPVVGWVIDFAEIKRHVNEVLEPLDHHLLNEVPGLEQPTTERIAAWIWNELKPRMNGLCKITLWENRNSGCTYTGPAIEPGSTNG